MFVRHLVSALAGVLVLAPAARPADAILPGRGVGRVHLGEELGVVTRTLGQPRAVDFAMGRSWCLWGGTARTPAELGVYTSIYGDYPDGRPNPRGRQLVEQVRVTSPRFRARSVGVGSGLDAVRRAFPGVRLLGRGYASPNPPPNDFLASRIFLYDDRRAGIAFEFGGDRPVAGHCVAVVVHLKGRSVFDAIGLSKSRPPTIDPPLPRRVRLKKVTHVPAPGSGRPRP